MPISIVSTFLLVAMKEDRTVTELAATAGVTMGTMSRQLADLSSTNRHGAPGLGLIEQRIQLYDRRCTKNRLTPKGHAFARQIADAMERRAVSEAA
jgi:DNA-binding MarR family transcriptional regulator